MQALGHVSMGHLLRLLPRMATGAAVLLVLPLLLHRHHHLLLLPPLLSRSSSTNPHGVGLPLATELYYCVYSFFSFPAPKKENFVVAGAEFMLRVAHEKVKNR